MLLVRLQELDPSYTTLARWNLQKDVLVWLFLDLSQQASVYSVYSSIFVFFWSTFDRTGKREEKPQERIETSCTRTQLGCFWPPVRAEQSSMKWTQKRRNKQKKKGGRELKPPKKKNWLSTNEWKEPNDSSQINPAGYLHGRKWICYPSLYRNRADQDVAMATRWHGTQAAHVASANGSPPHWRDRLALIGREASGRHSVNPSET